MAAETVRITGGSGISGALFALVDADGSGSHAHLKRLTAPHAGLRDVADALHIACMLHGRHPGIIDHAITHTPVEGAAEWLADASAAFARERQRLAALVAAAGPLPSTPGQAESEAAVSAQRHALDTLGQSDRLGCAFGAAVALMLDWHAIRAILDSAADRLGLYADPARLPPPFETAVALDALATAPGIERATMFGAQQLLAQQRGLWDLLEARAEARAAV
ncbi:DUF6975 family protein [Sphingomonas baiyangensis]|uniref:Uncharacterized protein n=1 Tax=Sphingomonas baiyangensis TaxID=2572576 RepID=A0A4V5PTP5_9SPHN|nr:hypothetical protein [Sphingomonas baiyangensis]TKD50798.1 hypothetical protein FBR43_08465 [Sphingomonas baiyangensis]